MLEVLELAYLIIPVGILIVVFLPVFYLLFLKKFLAALSLLAFILCWTVVIVYLYVYIGLSILSLSLSSFDASLTILFMSIVVGVALYLAIFIKALRSDKVANKARYEH